MRKVRWVIADRVGKGVTPFHDAEIPEDIALIQFWKENVTVTEPSIQAIAIAWGRHYRNGYEIEYGVLTAIETGDVIQVEIPTPQGPDQVNVLLLSFVEIPNIIEDASGGSGNEELTEMYVRCDSLDQAMLSGEQVAQEMGRLEELPKNQAPKCLTKQQMTCSFEPGRAGSLRSGSGIQPGSVGNVPKDCRPNQREYCVGSTADRPCLTGVKDLWGMSSTSSALPARASAQPATTRGLTK
jgi:hypothetical protein